MSTSLAEKISQTFLTCDICYKPVNEPKALSCNHGFCKGCLKACHEASVNKDVISCAVCQQVTEIPTGVDGLPTHFLVNSLKEVVLEHGVKPSVKDIPCNTCTSAHTRNAKVQCIDCKKYICQPCYTEHNKFIQDHQIVTLSDLFMGKVALSEDMERTKMCAKHDKKIMFYCEVDMRSICQTCIESGECPEDHNRIEIDKAVGHFQSNLCELVEACTEMKQACQEAVIETEKVRKEFERNKVLVRKTIARMKNKYVQTIEKIFQKHEKEIEDIEVERAQQILDTKINLESMVNTIDLACEQVEKLHPACGVASESVFQYASLCTTLESITSAEPEAASRVLGHVSFVATALPMIASLGKLHLKEVYSPDTSWELQGYISTDGLARPTAVAVCNDGSIVVTSWENSSNIYTRSGEVVNTFKNSSPAISILITDAGEYVVAHINDHNITWYDADGVAIRAVPVMSFDSSSSSLNSITCDQRGRIIVATVKNTIAVCAPNIISKFKTRMTPFRIAATSNDRLVVIYYSVELKKPASTEIMDYSGSNSQELLQPPDVNIWTPSFLCCSSKGEIFISNRGDPQGVYRYDITGEYLGCVAMDISSPQGLALSDDEMELYVVDDVNKRVNIYRRQ